MSAPTALGSTRGASIQHMVQGLMSRATRFLLCLAAVLGMAFICAGTAAATGGGGSAGNSQYVDPLGGNGHHHNSGPSASSPSTTTTATTSSGSGNTLTSSPPSSVSSGSAASPSSTTGSSATTNDPPHTLPYTGLNVWACALLGLVLLAAGATLRRSLADSE
jgi:hypothetical protein